MAERLTDVLESQQFSREFLEAELFPLAKQQEDVFRRGGNNLLRRRRVDIVFYEPSTRTRNSFEKAVDFLGGRFFSTENAKDFSSAAKGESIEDTARILEAYGTDCLVIRHHEVGGVARAAQAVKIPVINAGDGAGQHPTQALLDVYTLKVQHGAIEGLSVAMIGDLRNGRTVRSLSYLLGKYPGVNLDFVAPPGFGMKQDILDHLEEHGVAHTTNRSLAEVLPDCDAAYIVRPQLERLGGAENLNHGLDSKDYRIDLEALSKMRRYAIVMHPLPRTEELPPEVDIDPRVVVIKQAQNGLFIRMALLEMILA